MNHHKAIWLLQWLFGLYFIAIGVVHLTLPSGLPVQLSWMYELGDTLHLVVGPAEILGGLGLIAPGLTGIWPELTIWAAVGLAVVMVGAIVFHVGREEPLSIAINMINILAMGYIAYGRWRLAPLEGQTRGSGAG